ncbi:AfaD family invasin, partial [Enterobacter ludwigii]|uniref:AfaD family invasin n=1 Tax=Enterobacter ludwigii TaxID=299767 RepID=UPI00273F8601
VLGRGRVTYSGPHNGFRIWMPGERQGGGPDRYMLSPPPGAAAPVRVRLEADNGQPDAATGQGVVSLSPGGSISFRLVADGNQQAGAGQWSARISAAALLTE